MTLNQPIFRGGRTWAEIGRAKALVRAGRAQLAGAEQTVLLAAVTAYMDVVRDQAIVESAPAQCRCADRSSSRPPSFSSRSAS